MKKTITKLEVIGFAFILIIISIVFGLNKNVKAAGYFEGDNLSIGSGQAKTGAWAYLYVGTEYTMFVSDKSGNEYSSSFRVGNGGGLNNNQAIGNLKHYNWDKGGVGNSSGTIYVDDNTVYEFAKRISWEVGEAVRNQKASYTISARTLIYVTPYKTGGGTGYSWEYGTALWRTIQEKGIKSSSSGMGSIYGIVNTVVHNLYEDDSLGGGSPYNVLYGFDVIANKEGIPTYYNVSVKYCDIDGNVLYQKSLGQHEEGSTLSTNLEQTIPGCPEYNNLNHSYYILGGNTLGQYGIKYRYGDFYYAGEDTYNQSVYVTDNTTIYAYYNRSNIVTVHYVMLDQPNPILSEVLGYYTPWSTQNFTLRQSVNGYAAYKSCYFNADYYDLPDGEQAINAQVGNTTKVTKQKEPWDPIPTTLDNVINREIVIEGDMDIYVYLDYQGINAKYIDIDTKEVFYEDFLGTVGYGNTYEYWAEDVPLVVNGITYTKCLKSYYVDGIHDGYISDTSQHRNRKFLYATDGYPESGYYVRYQDLVNVTDNKTIYFEYQKEKTVNVTVQYKQAKDMHSEYNQSTCLNANSTNVQPSVTYTFKEGINITSSEFQTDIYGNQYAGISLPSEIDGHKLSASYILGLNDGEVWHVDGNAKTRNPGVINNDITIIAEYDNGGRITGEQVTVTVYYKQDIGGHANYNSSTCLKQSSTNVPNASTAVAALNRPASATEINIGNPTTYKFPKGTDISGINAIPLPGEIGEYKLSASYLLNLDGVSGVQYHVGSGYTKRSPDILNYDLTIIAEYGKNVEVDTVEDFEMEDLDNNARGLIASERKDSQLYDVYNGIPTHEEVYANAKANEFLYNAEVQKVSGNRDYTVKVTVPFSFSWKCSGCECGGGHDLGHNDSCKPDCEKTHTGKIDGCTCYCSGHSGTASHTFTYTINREFSYWTVNSYQIYRINTAYIENNILVNSGYVQWNGNTVDIDKWINTTKADHLNFHFSNTFATSVTTGNKSVVLSPGTSADYDVSTYDFESNWNSTYKTNAEAAVPQIQVKNDKLIVNGETIVAGETWQDKDGTRPNINKQVSGDKEFDKRNIQIPIYFKNKKYDTTQSRIRYVSQDRYSQEKGNDIVTTIKGFSNKNRASDIDNTPDINMVNDVIVHTPVYIRAELSDDQEYNQKINISDEARNTIVLDKEFTINFWLWGQHRNIDGYGNNNYSEYMKDTEIKVPFDVYIKAKNSNSYQLLSANTWYNIESYLDTDWNGDVTFKIPVWVDEGLYVGANSIMLRVIAENDQQPSDRDTLGIEEANKDGSRKIYSNENVDYRAYWHIPVDVVGRVYNFKLEYTDDPSFENTMNTGFAGESIDQLPFPEKGDNILNQYYTYAAKLGYKFKFSLSTKGTKSNEIEIIPHFYYVSKKAANGYQIKEEDKVDVYYTNSKGNKELLNSASTFSLTTNLTKEGELPYIESDLITNTRNVLNAYKNGTMRKVNGYGPAGYWYNYNSTVGIGTVGKVILNEATRLRYDNIQNYLNENTYGTTNRSTLVANAGSENNIVSRISNWYGEYRLPSTSTFVKGNKTIEEDGYVIVYFEIKTNYNDGTRNEYLSYQLSNSSTQYQKEGWQANRDIELPNGRVVKDLPSSRNYASVFIYEAKLNNGKDTVGTH